jgi:hypothetical protein
VSEGPLGTALSERATAMAALVGSAVFREPDDAERRLRSGGGGGGIKEARVTQTRQLVLSVADGPPLALRQASTLQERVPEQLLLCLLPPLFHLHYGDRRRAWRWRRQPASCAGSLPPPSCWRSQPQPWSGATWPAPPFVRRAESPLSRRRRSLEMERRRRFSLWLSLAQQLPLRQILTYCGQEEEEVGRKTTGMGPSTRRRGSNL